MRDYELILIVDPTVADDAVPLVTDRIKGWVADHGGEVTNVNPWGRRRLAYSIRERRDGHYLAVQMRIESAATRELERTLELAEDILRHLLVRRGD